MVQAVREAVVAMAGTADLPCIRALTELAARLRRAEEALAMSRPSAERTKLLTAALAFAKASERGEATGECNDLCTAACKYARYIREGGSAALKKGGR
ncbi:MAG: hypothetical protein ACK4N5_05885 [Myxococcales bacterium]